MTFSDGLPVQFWLADCETFNEKEVDGINPACWCQPFKCDDEINLQFQADETSPVTEYSLLIKDASGAYLSEIPFDNTGENTFTASFTPNDEDICDEQISLEIADAGDVVKLLAPSSWDNPGGSYSDFDTKGASTFVEALTSADGVVGATIPAVVPAGTSIVITYSMEVSGTWVGGGSPNIITAFTLRDGSDNNVGTNLLSTASRSISSNGTYNYTEVITATGTSEKLLFILGENISSGTANVTITITPDTVLYVQPLAKSDCLNIRTAHSGTELIQYSNNRNFAGLIYEDVSPPSTFYLRVPAVFFHQRFPQESRAIERTSSTIVTSSKLKKQRLMQVLHAPAYFHAKMIIALSHHNVSIDNKQWKMEEGYEMDEGNQHYPLKKGTVYLTEKNYLARNAL